jgi:hypothetical protein
LRENNPPATEEVSSKDERVDSLQENIPDCLCEGALGTLVACETKVLKRRRVVHAESRENDPATEVRLWFSS